MRRARFAGRLVEPRHLLARFRRAALGFGRGSIQNVLHEKQASPQTILHGRFCRAVHGEIDNAFPHTSRSKFGMHMRGRGGKQMKYDPGLPSDATPTFLFPKT